MFTCTVSTSRVEWIAEPYFSGSAQFTNDPDENGVAISNDFGPSDGIIIRQVGTNPLMTVMMVQGNLINESFSAMCTPQLLDGTLLTNDTEEQEYASACK